MKAAVFNEANQPLIIKEIDIEEPRSREVMVKISNCGICHSDLSMLDLGGAGQLPVILGHEAAGTIDGLFYLFFNDKTTDNSTKKTCCFNKKS